MSSIPLTHRPGEWQIVLRKPATGTLVLYNSVSNEVSAISRPNPLEGPRDHIEEISSASAASSRTSSSANARRPDPSDFCPLCGQLVHAARPHPRFSKPLPTGNLKTVADGSYFRLLSKTSTPQPSRPVTPSSPAISGEATDSPRQPDEPTRKPSEGSRRAKGKSTQLDDDARVDGYYQRFFVEVKKLGRGQKGSVFLCQHVLDGNCLGYYAVKKIAVGQSSPELLAVLREIKFLEALRHPNITQYHHAWIERTALTRFGPAVPVLFVLMDYANGGSLDGWIRGRAGDVGDGESRGEGGEDEERRRRRRKATWKKTHGLPLSEQELGLEQDSSKLAVHLLSIEEIISVFEDVSRGLAFLHSKGILHHDLKSENVLLDWSDGEALMPRALISDFGSSMAFSENWCRDRTGRTGTLDWTPPESFEIDPKTGRLHEVGQKGDIWQLGLILHFLCFFRLPYKESEDIDNLIAEIRAYTGFLLTFATTSEYHPRPDLPLSLLKLLKELLHLDPAQRPSCELTLKRLVALRTELSIGATVIPSDVESGDGGALVKVERSPSVPILDPFEAETPSSVVKAVQGLEEGIQQQYTKDPGDGKQPGRRQCFFAAFVVVKALVLNRLSGARLVTSSSSLVSTLGNVFEVVLCNPYVSTAITTSQFYWVLSENWRS